MRPLLRLNCSWKQRPSDWLNVILPWSLQAHSNIFPHLSLISRSKRTFKVKEHHWIFTKDQLLSAQMNEELGMWSECVVSTGLQWGWAIATMCTRQGFTALDGRVRACGGVMCSNTVTIATGPHCGFYFRRQPWSVLSRLFDTQNLRTYLWPLSPFFQSDKYFKKHAVQ